MLSRDPAGTRNCPAAAAPSLVIPLFLPHEGCPYRCLFCNQTSISGHHGPPLDQLAVAREIRTWLDRALPARRRRVQVAFYGGSFTCLPSARQRELLGAVQPFLDQGAVQEIRLSTRPDAIDAAQLDLLIAHRVSVVELGAQSLDDLVLRRSGRGHDAAATWAAAGQIKDRGLVLGLQLMPGLPGENFASLRRTMAAVRTLRPDFVRLYPALVLRGSGLAQLHAGGAFRPLSLGRAVAWCAYLQKRFDDQGIRVVRMGLQPSPELEQTLVAGPYHPAFGELVRARAMLRQTRSALVGVTDTAPVTLVISPRDLSVFRGLGGANLERLGRLGLLSRFRLQTDPHQARQTLRVQADSGQTAGARPIKADGVRRSRAVFPLFSSDGAHAVEPEQLCDAALSRGPLASPLPRPRA